MNYLEILNTVHQFAYNPISIIKADSNGCLACLKLEEQRTLIERIDGFIQANQSILLEFRDDAVLQTHMQRLLCHCTVLKRSLAPSYCVVRFIQEFPLLKGMNPANKTIDKIECFFKAPPRLPLEIWDKILIHLKPMELIRFSITTKSIRGLCIRILIKEVNQKSLNDMGIDSRHICSFLRSLGSYRAQIIRLDLRESMPFTYFNDHLRAIITLVPQISFLAINSSGLNDSHLRAIASLAKLKHLDLYRSQNFSEETLSQLRDRKELRLSLHTVKMRREIQIEDAVRWAEMEAAYYRRLDARLSRRF